MPKTLKFAKFYLCIFLLPSEVSQNISTHKGSNEVVIGIQLMNVLSNFLAK